MNVAEENCFTLQGLLLFIFAEADSLHAVSRNVHEIKVGCISGLGVLFVTMTRSSSAGRFQPL